MMADNATGSVPPGELAFLGFRTHSHRRAGSYALKRSTLPWAASVQLAKLSNVPYR